MKKEYKMIKLKKENVESRRCAIKKACDELVAESSSITYGEVENRTGIPKKTLQRDPYKTDISYYRDLKSERTYGANDINALKDKISYLKKIIVQLNKENHNLKTKLFEDNKI